MPAKAVAAPPDPMTEIRLRGLHSARGLNYWSRRPVIRMDLAVGAFDEISSAEVPTCRKALADALPGLVEHHCSIGSRGGFLQRLREGTYAPHIIEHVALELQSMIGHEVGYGKTRGGEEPGEYTLVFEHKHEQVGLRAAAMALEIVQQAFSGREVLAPLGPALDELRALDRTPDSAPLVARVFCGITGGALRVETQAALDRLPLAEGAQRLVVDVAPAYVLRAGLPYARSEMCVVLDTALADVAERYREGENARKLLATLIDGTRRDGVAVVPAKEWELQDYARDERCQVAVFATDADLTRKDRRVAMAHAYVKDGMIRVSVHGDEIEPRKLIVRGEREGDPEELPVAPQVVAALVGALIEAGVVGAPAVAAPAGR